MAYQLTCEGKNIGYGKADNKPTPPPYMINNPLDL